MAKCDHCHDRKGKRACPYLKGSICSVCCGENRGVNFDCPRDCPYFEPAPGRETAAAGTARPSTGSEAARPAPPPAPAAAGSPRIDGAPVSNRTPPAALGAAPEGAAVSAPDLSRYQKFLSGERRVLADLMARIEFMIARYDRERRGLTDGDAVLGLEYLRRRVGPIIAVERFAPELGAFLEKAVAEMFRSAPAPRPHDLSEVLDHLIGIARNFGPPGGRRYLEQVGLLEASSRAASAEPPSEPPGPRIILPR